MAGIELIALRMPKDKKHLIPTFKYYREINNFTGFREYAALFATPEMAARLATEPNQSATTPGIQRTPN